jgi:hypothetical protein
MRYRGLDFDAIEEHTNDPDGKPINNNNYF